MALEKYDLPHKDILPISEGGTGANTAKQARANLQTIFYERVSNLNYTNADDLPEGIFNVDTSLENTPVLDKGILVSFKTPTPYQLYYIDHYTMCYKRIYENGQWGNWMSLDWVRVGVVSAFGGNEIPNGYLPCNGSAISRTTYADLFAVIGTTYGDGDGNTTFNLPNLTDKFIQGSDTAGTVKSAGLPNISGVAFISGAFDAYGCSGNGCLDVWASGTSKSVTQSGAGDISFSIDASKSSSIYGNSNTVQPSALTMRYIIKY